MTNSHWIKRTNNELTKNREIDRFLDAINSMTGMLIIRRYKSKDKDDTRSITFEAILNSDFFVESGLPNFSNKYFSEIRKAAKKHLKTDVTFNNTGGIFWFYPKE